MRRFDAGGVSSVCCVTNMSVDRDPGRRKKHIFQFAGHLITLALEAHQRREASQALILAKEAAKSPAGPRASSGPASAMTWNARECDYRMKDLPWKLI
jgi:hypothetical protein